MEVGSAVEDLRFEDGHGLFGFGPRGGAGVRVPRGSDDHDVLQARALFVRDGGGAKLLVVGLDLASGSRIVHRALVEALAKHGRPLLRGEVCVVGTHTHSGPGHYFGNLYDVFGQRPASYRREVATEIVRRALAASVRAMSEPRECEVGVAEKVLWGAGRNRSLGAFLANFDGDPGRWSETMGPRYSPPIHLSPEERSVDPRLRVIAFVGAGDRRVLATWATWCCHAACFGPAPLRAYHRDWPGVAVDHVEREARAASFAFIHQGANGDVTALPSGARRVARPVERIRAIGEAVGAAWVEAVGDAARAAVSGRLEVGYRTMRAESCGLPEFEIGQSVVAGSEEADPGYLVRAFGEARRWPFGRSPHYPKLPALGPLQRLLRARLRPSPEHPLSLLRLGSHVFFASPFEQTTAAAWRTEQALATTWLRKRGEALTFSPLGLVSDYAGYLTTAEEYALQQYEGGHTLYGPEQRPTLERLWSDMIGTGPLDPTAPTTGPAEPELESRVREIVDVL